MIKDIKELERIVERLRESGRLDEILDEDRQIRPSESTLKRIRRENPHAKPAERFQLAQAQTLIDLANEYQIELN
jgi:hypothetical protein